VVVVAVEVVAEDMVEDGADPAEVEVDTPVDIPVEGAVMAGVNDLLMLKPGEDTAPGDTAEAEAVATATAEVEVVDTAEDTALAAVGEDTEEVMAGESKLVTPALYLIIQNPSIHLSCNLFTLIIRNIARFQSTKIANVEVEINK